MRPDHVVLVHDRGGVPVREAVLVAQPVDPLLETDQPWSVLEFPEPLRELTARCAGDPGNELLMRLLGVVQGHERLPMNGTCLEPAPRVPLRQDPGWHDTVRDAADTLELVSDVTGAGLATLERELRRVSDRLGHLALTRLTGPTAASAIAPVAAAGAGSGSADGAATPAGAAWAVVQRLADLCEGLESAAAPSPPQRRVVPRLDPQVLADQLLVTGHDLLLAAEQAAASPGGPAPWLDGQRAAVSEVVQAAYEALVALRRSL